MSGCELRLPAFVEKELAKISSELSPVKLSIKELILHQQEYNKKAVSVEGYVQTVISIDQTDEATVATWFFEIFPTTVKMTASQHTSTLKAILEIRFLSSIQLILMYLSKTT